MSTCVTLTDALAVQAAGFAVVPPCEDSSKEPLTELVTMAELTKRLGPEVAQTILRGRAQARIWAHWRHQPPSVEQLRRWYQRGRSGIGALTGAVSGNLELLEFDDYDTYLVFKELAAATGLGELVERIEAGYCEQTPGGGVHWLARCSEVSGNTKLARRPKRPEEMRHASDAVKTLIETKGEGGYVILAPSHGRVHPSGGTYQLLRGGVTTIATITPEERGDLWALARTFDQMPASHARAVRQQGQHSRTRAGRPGDAFNLSATWEDVLAPHGWTHLYDRDAVGYWRRPGKDRGVSATTNWQGSDLLYVFSTSTPFDAERGYSKFTAYAVLNHGGDFSAAARALAAGYGSPYTVQPHESAPASGAPLLPEDQAPTSDRRGNKNEQAEDVVASHADAPYDAGPRWRRGRDSGADGKERGPSQADLLVQITDDLDLLHDLAGDTYARMAVDGHWEVWPTRSKGFRRWLVRQFYQRHDKAPHSEAISAALLVIEARAQFDGPCRTVHVRVAPDSSDGLYLDLGDANWRAVHITGRGWTIVAEPGVLFRRAPGQLALPVPEAGGSLDELRPLVNVPDDAAWALVCAWLAGALSPRGPYPVLALRGEQGSAKSTLARMLRALVDPATLDLRTEPRDGRDLAIAARGNHIVALDNVSHIQPWLSDALCRLTTGGGWATRELYTDRDEVLFSAMRPVLLNGITEYATRSDLLDRMVALELPSIPEGRRRSEAGLWGEFERLRSRLLGALLDRLAGALRELPNVQLERLPRMADFAIWAVAAERAAGHPGHLPSPFLAAFAGMRAEANELAIDGSAIGPCLRRILDRDGSFTGTAAMLLDALATVAGESLVRSAVWPRTPRAVAGELRRLAPALRAVGITVQLGVRRHGGVRVIQIGCADQAASPSPSSPLSAGAAELLGDDEPDQGWGDGPEAEVTVAAGAADQPSPASAVTGPTARFANALRCNDSDGGVGGDGGATCKAEDVPCSFTGCSCKSHRRDASGDAWCIQHDRQCEVIELARAATWPRLPLTPVTETVGPGEAAWRAWARRTATIDVDIACRLLRRAPEPRRHPYPFQSSPSV
jgi:hypothetical protein